MTMKVIMTGRQLHFPSISMRKWATNRTDEADYENNNSGNCGDGGGEKEEENEKLNGRKGRPNERRRLHDAAGEK